MNSYVEIAVGDIVRIDMEEWLMSSLCTHEKYEKIITTKWPTLCVGDLKSSNKIWSVNKILIHDNTNRGRFVNLNPSLDTSVDKWCGQTNGVLSPIIYIREIVGHPSWDEESINQLIMLKNGEAPNNGLGWAVTPSFIQKVYMQRPEIKIGRNGPI